MAFTPPPVNPPTIVVAANSASATAPVINASQMPMNPAASYQYDGTLTGDWFGYRSTIENRGITFGGSLIQDTSWNLTGGISTHNTIYRARMDLNVSFSTEKLIGLPGGQLYCDMMSIWGQDGNNSLLGTLQGFDDIDASPSLTEVYELYYRQKLLDNKLEFKIGRMDANSIFDAQPYTGSFLIPSNTNAATDFLLPTFPIPVPGVVTYIRPTANTTLILGAFYTDRFHPTAFDEFLNTLEPVNQPVGTFLIGELDQQYKLADKLPGEAGIGGFYHIGHVDRLDSGIQNGFGSVYGFIDQTIWQPSDYESLACFTTLSTVDGHVSQIDYMANGGLLGTGLLPGRPDDQTGLAMDWAHVSNRAELPKPFELGMESFYQINLGRGIALQRDFQYWINPGGGAHPDALVATIRLSVSF